MNHVCSQCSKTFTVEKRFKVVADMDTHSFCSAECRDDWLCLNGAGSQAVMVAQERLLKNIHRKQMRKLKIFRYVLISLLAFVSLICSTAKFAFSQDLIPDWTGVSHAPFNLVEPSGITNPILTADDVTDVYATFVADPFLFHENGEWYMFFEVWNSVNDHGDIALATSYDGLYWQYQGIILSEDWHLAYPLVFKWDGEYYLIPETNTLNEVRIYRANNFPYDWVYVSTIISGRSFVDATVFHYHDTWWMFVSDTSWSNCYLYYSDTLSSGWTKHPKSPIVSNDKSKARPGGRSFVLDNDRIIRIAQKNDVVYGEAVRAFEVDILTKTDYAEHEVPESPLLTKSGIGWNKTGMHQFDPWWNGDHWLCVVDGKSGGDRTWGIGVMTAPLPCFPDKPPIADAGIDQKVTEGVTVTLDGSGSTSLEDTNISYSWTQTGGPPVTLSDPTAVKPTFVTPPAAPEGAMLTFQLTVMGECGLQAADSVSAYIFDNGITGFPEDVLTMTCSTGKQIGMKVESGGDWVSLEVAEPSTIPDSSDKPENLPFGLFDLLIKSDSVGGIVKVTFYLESQAGNDEKWFKYKTSTGIWEDCSVYASFNAARDQVTVTLVDGGDGDDGPADGWIVDQSGLSSPASTSTSSGGGGGGGGCFIDTAADGQT